MTLITPSRPLSALVALSACLLAACGPKEEAAVPAVTADAGEATITIRLGHVAPLTARRPTSARTTRTAPGWPSTT